MCEERPCWPTLRLGPDEKSFSSKPSWGLGFIQKQVVLKNPICHSIAKLQCFSIHKGNTVPGCNDQESENRVEDDFIYIQHTVLLSSLPTSVAGIRPHDVLLASGVCILF
ncbi:hypothetical protein M9H77_08813 [Catharanthus roseus]|uniref:Uncharacterized protein n=1 Tax=Catharanthus roseus TaxID=4058 RepID=A0ACC0BZ99_CATRO|nr:hypothetical protein M9H77_08813 [Catharanthus roseus]